VTHPYLKNGLLIRRRSGSSETTPSKPGDVGLDWIKKVFHRRYHNVKDQRFNLDDSDDPWFRNHLRDSDAASKMEHYCITSTGLKSPTNDSKPPDDPK
jgi:hypothetical protein